MIGGPGAFIVVAEDYTAFASAILSKLLLEIAGDTPPARPLAATLRSNGSGSASGALHVGLQSSRDESVGRRGDAKLLTKSDNRAGEPR